MKKYLSIIDFTDCNRLFTSQNDEEMIEKIFDNTMSSSISYGSVRSPLK